MAKAKTKGANLPVPQNREEAVSTVTDIGALNRDLARLEADMNDQLAAIKTEFEAKALPLKEAVEAKTEGLKIWAEANRTSLTGGGKTKTVDLGTGLLRWRIRPTAVRLTGVEDVIERLKSLGFQRFLRTKEEVNKEAMLNEPDVARQVAGVRIGSAGEDFIVEPFETELSVEPAQA
ncbi:host-nuclease inhibitor Gam family protein [Paradevosia shaoguanensis]|uniref:Host-nuclease inhibitor Gam family protein n=1 Tax=Paradevosia shaoguanensis TaxID=1335043 RepID=A0AA41UIA0_9HYPH|nr:host-nuclease inhibitor Gam family protein [Paradevosia shaoguanensis]MCF1744648.1 host-nuclease inhibitor Gam family protein [Paradevosia shaoguanensis]MCI0129131.1 host-nuclease inhibitor Gam family protein [Paradevosia shaoguanensis]